MPIVAMEKTSFYGNVSDGELKFKVMLEHGDDF